MHRSFLFIAHLSLIYFSLPVIIVNGKDTCLEKNSGIYLTRDNNQIVYLTFYSSDGTLITIDSNQKAGNPTIEGRNDRAGRWKCQESRKPYILTQSIQVEESTNITAPLVTRLYETGVKCLNNKRKNCNDNIQYRELNITISLEPPEQIYELSSTIYSSKGDSVLLHYSGYGHQNNQARQCLREKSGMYVIEYQKNASNDGLNKTYGLLQLKYDGFFFLVNSNQREYGTHKFGTTLGRWKCIGNRILAIGNYFSYYPQQKLGEVRFNLKHCTSPMTRACTGHVESFDYPLQLHQRPFKNGTRKAKKNIKVMKYSSATITNNNTCYNRLAGTYFFKLGNDNTSYASLLNGTYRTTQLYKDGSVYGNALAELPVDNADGALIGYWTCEEINSNLTHIQVGGIAFIYDSSEGGKQANLINYSTCDNTLRNCTGQSSYRVYNSQLPDHGQFNQAVATYTIEPVLQFYSYLPPY